MVADEEHAPEAREEIVEGLAVDHRRLVDDHERLGLIAVGRAEHPSLAVGRRRGGRSPSDRRRGDALALEHRGGATRGGDDRGREAAEEPDTSEVLPVPASPRSAKTREPLLCQR